MEERLDKLLIARNLVSSRVRAEQIIEEVGVRVNGKLIMKTGKKVPVDAKIELIADEIPWVSKDALKLEEAFLKWNFEIKGKSFLDIGCSTGGFSEFLIKNDASKVYGIDNSKQIVHHSILDLENFHNLTGTLLRELTINSLDEAVDAIVVNTPFLPMEKVFPFLLPLLKKNGYIIAVLKPDFESDKSFLKHDGSAKNELIYPHIIEKVSKIARDNQLVLVKNIFSPILGNNGHKELIGYFERL